MAADSDSLLLHRSTAKCPYFVQVFIYRALLRTSHFLSAGLSSQCSSVTRSRLMTDLTAVVRPFITRSTTRTVVLTGDRRRSSDSPEIPYILRNWSNHYRLHKISQFTFFQSPINLAHKIRPHSFRPLLDNLPIYSQFIQVVICALLFPRAVDTRYELTVCTKISDILCSVQCQQQPAHYTIFPLFMSQQ